MRFHFSRSRRAAERLAACAFLLTLATTSCSKSTPPAPPPAEAPLPEAPPQLLLELILPRPSHAYSAVATLLGGSGGGGALPSAPLLLGSLADLPPESWSELDLDLPAFGAAMDAEPNPGGALALHVKDGPRLVSMLTGRAEAAFVAENDAASGATVLAPKNKAVHTPALAVLANYLLVATEPQLARALAPYLARTLPARGIEKKDDDATLSIPRSAFLGPLSARLLTLFRAFRAEREADDLAMRKRHGASAPDLGDVSAALADLGGTVERFATLLPDVEKARATLRIEGASIHLRAVADAASPGGAVAHFFNVFSVGNVAPLLDLPASTVLAMLARDASGQRQEAAREQAAALSALLQGRLTSAEAALLGRMLSRWASARGDWVTAGAVATPGALSAFYRAPVVDAKAARATLPDVARLFGAPALREPIAKFFGDLGDAPASAAGSPALPTVLPDGVTLVHATHSPAKLSLPASVVEGNATPPDTEPFDIAWKLDDESFVCAAGKDAATGYRALVAHEASDTLAHDPEAAATLTALGNDAAFVLFVEPMRFMPRMTSGRAPPSAPANAPLTLSYGRTGSEGWLRLDMASRVVTAVYEAYVHSAQRH